MSKSTQFCNFDDNGNERTNCQQQGNLMTLWNYNYKFFPHRYLRFSLEFKPDLVIKYIQNNLIIRDRKRI